MGNSRNDYDKHVEALSNHLEVVVGDDWREMTPVELVKCLARTIHGLNGGPPELMGDAKKVVMFDDHNVVPTHDGAFQVLTMIEWQSQDMETLH